MNVISKRELQKLMAEKPETGKEINAWHRQASAAKWENLADVRRDFPSADLVGRILIFNIRHNRYRLIVREAFAFKRLYIKALLTHKEYEREAWKKWA